MAEALCWGGPLDGEWWVSDTAVIRYHKPSAAAVRWDQPAPAELIPYQEGFYTLEKIGVSVGEERLVFWAWLIDKPAEHREFHMHRVIGGLRLVAALAAGRFWAS